MKGFGVQATGFRLIVYRLTFHDILALKFTIERHTVMHNSGFTINCRNSGNGIAFDH